MSYYGPPMPPQFPLPKRRPRGLKPRGKKPAAAKPAPKAMSEQQKTTVAKTTMAKHHSIPMPQMDSANKASLADEDCRIQLTQKELDMVYHSVVSSLNSGHGSMNVQIGGSSVNSVRLSTKIKIKLPTSVAAKLHKNHIYRHHAADVQPTAEQQELDEDGNIPV